MPFTNRICLITLKKSIQKILDSEQPLLGIRNFVVLSSFNQKEPTNKIFFTSNWYTYGFVNVAMHMGSYLNQEKQVLQRYGSSSFFQIKYVFTCQFIENWQKVDKIQTNKNDFLTKKTQRHKTILYNMSGKPYKNMFNQLLQFKLQHKKKYSGNSIHDFNVNVKNQGPLNKNSQFPRKQYRISEWNFNFILRTRYQQGWQPIVHEKKNDKITKCVFKMDFSPNVCMIYKAELNSSNEGSFYSIQIGSKLNNQGNFKKCKNSLEGLQIKSKQKIFDLIEHIDLICTSQYKSLHTNLLDQIGFKRRQYLSPFSLSQEFQTKSLRYVLNNPNEWGKFSKLKYLYFNFYPSLSRLLLEQFLNQINFFLGQKISESIFMKKGWDKNQKKQIKQNKIQFSQLIRKNNMIKIKIAYVNYAFHEIKHILEPFAHKFQTKKFKSGEAMIVSDELFKFNEMNQIAANNSLLNSCSQKMFTNKWKLKIKDSLTFKSFTYYFKALLKVQGFQEIGQRRAIPSLKSYAKRILVNQVKQQFEGKHGDHINSVIGQHEKSAQKTIFCNIQSSPNNELTFCFLMFPLIGKLTTFDNEQNIFQDSQKYISNQVESKQLSRSSFRNQISAYDLFSRFTQNLRVMQIKIMKIIFTYNQIHEILLLKAMQNIRINKKSCMYSAQLKNLVKQLYFSRSSHHFDIQYENLCIKILQNYYSYSKQNEKKRKEVKQQVIDIDFIPEPQRFFIQADVPEIKGDMTLRKNGKQYIFFLFSPYHPLYICKNQNKFFYKSVNLMMFEDINIQQSSNHSLQIMINQISTIIQKQQYRKLYSQFFYAPENLIAIIKLSSDSKQKYDESAKKKDQTNDKSVYFQAFIKKIQKFNPPSQNIFNMNSAIQFFGIKINEERSPKQITKNLAQQLELSNNLMNEEIDSKIYPLVKEFSSIYFDIIRIFFDRKAGNHYLQTQFKLQQSGNSLMQRFILNEQKMQDFNQLVLKNYMKLGNQEIIISQQNFTALLFQYKNELAKGGAKIFFLCYSQLKEQSLNNTQNVTFDYFLSIMYRLCQEFTLELQRIRINKEKDLQKFRKNQQQSNVFNKHQSISFERFYDKLANERFAKYVQSSTMQKLIALKKIPGQIYHYIAAKHSKYSKQLGISKNSISLKQLSKQQSAFFSQIPFWFKLQINESQIDIFYSQYQFFSRGEKMEDKVNKYVEQLVNYVNCDILISQINYTRQLPLQPHQLFVSLLVNHQSNKLVEAKKKAKQTKKGMKGIRGRIIQNQKKQNLNKVNSQGAASSNKTQPLPLLAKNFITLNQRFKSGQGLQAIKKYQHFQIFQIMNLRSTYSFPTASDDSSSLQKQNLIFHFEEDDFEKVYKEFNQTQISEVNGKPKRVLIYYVYGLNSSLTKTQNYQMINKGIKDAINLKNFQTLSHELFISPELIQPNEQKELKKGQSKQFKFQIPFIPYVDDFRGYLKQHILMYHTKTEFKSEKRTISKKNSTNANSDDVAFKVQRSQSLSSKSSFRKNQESLSKEKTQKQSFSQQYQISKLSHCVHSQSQSESFRTPSRDSSGSFLVFQDQKKGMSFGSKYQISAAQKQCEKCIPTMWLFNFKKNTKLQAKFGRCVYLLKIEVHHNVQTAENVQIWQKFIGIKKRKLYIGSNLSENQRLLLKQYLSGTKPQNSKADPEQNLFQTTVTFNILNYLGNPVQKAMEEVFSSIVKTSISDYYIQNCINYQKIKSSFLQFDSLLFKQHEEKISFTKQSLSFQINLEDINLQKTKSQTVLSLSNQKSEFIEVSQCLQSKVSENQHIESEKFLKRAITKYTDQEKLFREILHHSELVDKIIELSSNQSLFKVICNQNALIKNLKTYFKDFYEYLNHVFEQSAGCKNLFFIYYIQFKNNSKQTIFFIDEVQDRISELTATQKARKLSEKIQKICEMQNQNRNESSKQYHEIKKMGIILNDQFYQYVQTLRLKNISKTKKLLDTQIQTFSLKVKNIDLEEVQRCKIFLEDKSFCLTDYYFTRNLYIHYQISYEGFKYCSYNVSILLNNKLSDFLAPLQVWVQQKYRLVKFIKGIKQREVYELIPLVKNKKSTDNKFGFIFQLYLQTLKCGKKQEDQKRTKQIQLKQVSKSKILLALVFYDYPIHYLDGSLMNLRKQIAQIYEILMTCPIDYKDTEFPQYKGKDKFQLEGLGRQYISYLRQQYGYKINDRMISSMPELEKITQLNSV